MLSLHLRERLTQTVNVLDKKRTILHGGGGVSIAGGLLASRVN